MLKKNDEKILKNLKVLYVEDEEDILKFASMVLEDYVDKLFVARNGKEALEILKTEHIDLCITDILMPKLNGIDLIREIRKNYAKDIALIVATAHTETRYLLDCIELRVDGYILKPIDARETGAQIIPTVLEYDHEKKKCFVRFGEPMLFLSEDNKANAISILRDTLATMRWDFWERNGTFHRKDLDMDVERKKLFYSVEEYPPIDWEYESSCIYQPYTVPEYHLKPCKENAFLFRKQ